MPSGIDQPGGPGTRVFVYDDSSPWLDAAMTVARSPGPYTDLDLINATGVGIISPLDFEQIVGAFTLAPFSGRQQFLSHVNIRIGGADADGTAPTTLQLFNADLIFDNTTTLEYRTVGYSPGLLTTLFGVRRATEFGSFKDVIGIGGVFLYTTNTLIFRGNMRIYGSLIGSTQGTIQFLDNGGAFAEVCGNLIFPGASVTLGNNGSPQMIAQNNVIVSQLNSIPLANASMIDGSGTTVAGDVNSTFLSSNTADLRLSGLRFIGTPGTSDLQWNSAAAANWNLIRHGWSQALDKPKMRSGANIPLSSSAKEWRYFNTKVSTPDGQPLADIPVQLTADIEGKIVDTKTFGDGDVGFATSVSVDNMVLVRDHYNPAGVDSYTTRERLFTLSVNGSGGIFPRNDLYPHVILRFQWPGRDTLRGAYSLGGGIFRDCIVPVTLGTIGGTPSDWMECSIP